MLDWIPLEKGGWDGSFEGRASADDQHEDAAFEVDRAACLVALVGSCAGISNAAALNICSTGGVTPAVAIKVFGAGTTIAVTNGSCAITTKKGASTFIDLQPASSFKNDLAYDNYSPKVKLGGLGTGAVLVGRPGQPYYSVLFAAGTHTVYIQSGGVQQASYPTAQQWKALAHTMYAHLA